MQYFIPFILILLLVLYIVHLNKRDKNQVFHSGTFPSIEMQKKGYIELINLCMENSKRKDLLNFINNLQDHNGDDEYSTTLNYVINHLDTNRIHFIMGLDWKQEIKDLVWKVNSSLNDNFNINVNLPEPESFGKTTSVSGKNVFKDFDKAIGMHNFKLGFIDTDADEYIIIVHRIMDEDKIRKV